MGQGQAPLQTAEAPFPWLPFPGREARDKNTPGVPRAVQVRHWASGSEDPGDKDIPTFVIHRLQALLALDVPQPDSFIMRAREQEAAICGD